MFSNRSGVVYASGAIAISALLRLVPHPCPLQAHAQQTSMDAGDWGTATNLSLQRRPDGVLISATAASGRHRVLKHLQIDKAGLYRLTVETKFNGAQSVLIELGGQPNQKYGLLIVDPKTGEIRKKSGDITGAGVDPVPGRPGWYRWWAEMNYAAGAVAVDVAILDNGQSTNFIGTSTCRVILSNPTFASK